MTGYRSALLVALLGFSPVLVAQDALDRELEFVRALAERMKFIELAKEEVDRLAKDHRAAGAQDRIAQLSVQISFYGAKSRAEREIQRTLFKEAIEKSRELIERSSDEKVLLQARATLADASQEFGQFLIEELEVARETDPEAVKALEEEAAGVFRAGIEACKKVKDALEIQMSGRDDPEQEIEIGLFWMRTGVLMREQGRAVREDRDVLVNRAVEELTEMVLYFGEETAIGLRGLFEIAQCYEVMEDMGTAMDMYRATIDQISTSLEDAPELGMPGNVQALLFEMMQEVFVRTGETMLSQGDPAAAELFAEFREKMAKFGEKGIELFQVVDPRWGHLLLLAEARFNAESGDQSKVATAIEMVQRINNAHPRDYVGIKAKAALADILAVQTSLVSGSLLFEIAKGEYLNKNYEAAVKGFRRAIAVMTPQEAATSGLEAWDMLGTAYYRTERYLEAMMAIGTGLERHGEQNRDEAGDPADRLDLSITLLKRQTKGDKTLDPLTNQYLELVANYTVGGKGKVFWKAGNDAYRDKDWARAIDQFGQVPEDFVFFETAKVRIAKAFVNAGDLANAKKALEVYTLYTTKKQLAAHASAKIQAREGALVEAEFLDGQITYWEARGNEALGVEQTPTLYPDAIRKLRDFVKNHGDDQANAPIAIECLGRLHADIGQMALAEQAYAQLKAKDGVRASRLASEIFMEYQRQEELLKKELDDVIAKEKGEAAIAAAQKDLDTVRAQIGALGLDYLANSAQPQLAIMVNTMIAFEHLADWKRVDEIAKKALDAFGADETPSVKNVIDLTVRTKIGEALLQQGKFTEAYKMLTEAEAANPNHWEIKRQICRCLGGWFVFDRAGRPMKEPGLDRPAEAYMKYFTEYKTWALRAEVQKYSLEWYRFHWECFWFAKQASLKDSEYKARAATFYRLAQSTDDFATLKSRGEEGLKLFKYFQINR